MTDATSIPNTLVLKDLLAPVKLTHNQLDEIARAHVKAGGIANTEDDRSFLDITNQGMFVLALSSLEVMMQDVQSCVLRHFPEKMGESQLKVGQVIGTVLVSDVLQSRAEDYVRGLMYKDTKGVLENFAKVTGLDLSSFWQDQIDCLIEMKETRNILLHNGLKVNETYQRKAGVSCRGTYLGQQLSIDSVYLGDSLVTIKYFIGEIGEGLQKKYNSYTRVAALKRLWDFMVIRSEITPFEEYWDIDSDQDVIRMKENPEFESRMSSTERHFLAMWRNLFVGMGAPPYAREFSFTGFDSDSRRKVAILLETAQRFGVLANR